MELESQLSDPETSIHGGAEALFLDLKSKQEVWAEQSTMELLAHYCYDCVYALCVGGCVYTRVHVHVESRGRPQVSFLRCHPSVWYSPSRLRWLANEPQESACPCLFTLRL